MLTKKSQHFIFAHFGAKNGTFRLKKGQKRECVTFSLFFNEKVAIYFVG
jgi:hypothetical protein